MATEKTTTSPKTPKSLIQEKWKNQLSDLAYEGLRTIFSGACFAMGTIAIHKVIGSSDSKVTLEEPSEVEGENILNFKVG